MKFIDEINIYVASGKGGDGLFSFSNIKTPDGGNGGKGGDIYLIGNKNNLTFSHLKFKSIYKAENGFSGSGNNKTGKNGKDLYITVPLGTLIYDYELNLLLGTILKHDDKLLIVKGGTPGLGNYYLKNKYLESNKFKIGAKSVLKFLHLELNILANVGLLGYSNVGKSSFINKISNVISKTGNYNFTTLVPILGVLKNYTKYKIVIADMPGITYLASQGRGLGLNFLKHISRTQLLLHFIDLVSMHNKFSLFKRILIINNELNSAYPESKKKWLILSKIDLYKNVYFFSFIKKLKIKYNYNLIFITSSKDKTGFKKLSFNIGEYFSNFIF